MSVSRSAATLSIRVSAQSIDKLKELADATGRTKSFLAAEAIEYYLSIQAWQIMAIQKAVKKANSPQAKFIEHQRVINWMNSWGNTDELDSPK